VSTTTKGHAARQAHDRARLSFRGGPRVHARCRPPGRGATRAPARPSFWRRRRWLVAPALACGRL